MPSKRKPVKRRNFAKIAKNVRARKPNPQKSRVLKITATMLRSRIPLTTTQIANKSGFSWNTAKDFLDFMASKNWVKPMRSGKVVRWKLLKK